MSEKERAAGLAVATIPLDVRFARAVGSNSCVERIFWNTLLPDLPQETKKRYFERVHSPASVRATMAGMTRAARERWEQKFRTFAECVLDGGPVPDLPDSSDPEDMQRLRINHHVLLADIAASTDMIPDVVMLDHGCWKIGNLRVAPRMDIRPAVRFVGQPGDCAETLANLGRGECPGGILVPCMEDLSDADFRLLRRHGFAIFGLVENCKWEKGRIATREPGAWIGLLDQQIRPEDLKAARLPPGLVMRRRPQDDTAKNENRAEACGPKVETASKTATRSDAKQACGNKHATDGGEQYPLKVGKLTVQNKKWKEITLEGTPVYLSPQIKDVFQAMHNLGAVNKERGKTKKEILTAAGIDTKRSFKNVFSSGGNKNECFLEVFNKCISIERNWPAPIYYLI